MTANTYVNDGEGRFWCPQVDYQPQRSNQIDPLVRDALADWTVQIQAAVASEELGDEVITGDPVVRKIMTGAGVEVAFDDARTVVEGVTRCLQTRYLGNCASAVMCSRRKEMDERIDRLGVTVAIARRSASVSA